MKLEEELLKLNEEELFGKVKKSKPVEQSEILKNYALLNNMISEAIDILKNRDNVLFEDAENISKMQNECMKWLGNSLKNLEKYM